jgi:phage major head subunit gpT-like protein
MFLTDETLDLVFRGFKTTFNDAYMEAQVNWDQIAMTVPSASREEQYGWLGNVPGMREWLGPRVVHSLKAYGFSIVNKKFESTVAVQREDIADDKLGIYKPAFAHMGQAARRHPEELIFGLLARGFETLCYDGQYFFDTDHPARTIEGVESTVSNMQAGSETPWFLFDTSKALRPMIWQEREAPELQTMRESSNPHVFKNDEFLYGVRSRANCGFGLWQLGFGSKDTLNGTNYAAARAAMMGFRGENGQLLGITPTVMVVPPALEEAALHILNAERNEAGASNVWKGTADLIVTPYLGA